mgnify:CR=1 FL=1
MRLRDACCVPWPSSSKVAMKSGTSHWLLYVPLACVLKAAAHDGAPAGACSTPDFSGVAVAVAAAAPAAASTQNGAGPLLARPVAAPADEVIAASACEELIREMMPDTFNEGELQYQWRPSGS